MNNCIKILTALLFFTLSGHFSFSQNAAAADQQVSTKEHTGETDFLSALTRRPDSLFFNSREDFVAQLKQLEIVSGYVYFSGTGFTQTQATFLTGSFLALKELLNRCGPGSRITLEKCIFVRKDKTRTPPVSKSLFIR